VRNGPDGGERDLEAALVALIEVALSGWEREGRPSEQQIRALARALAGAVREVIRAPLREALQAGYELGLRAAGEAAGGASSAPVPSEPAASSPPRVEPAGGASRVRPPQQASLPGSSLPPTAPADGRGPGESLAGSVAPREAAGVIVVEVSPFTSFTAVNRFHAAVAAAPGVSRAAIVSFQDGKLRLRVNHPDARTLATTLQAIDVGPLRVLRLASDHLELLLGSPPVPPVVGIGPPG